MRTKDKSINLMLIQQLNRQLNKSSLISASAFDPHFKHFESKKFAQKLNRLIDEDLMISERYLFVERIKTKVHTVCSHCGHRSTMKKVHKNYSTHECEKCKSKLLLRNVKYNSYKDGTNKSFIYFANSTLTNDVIVAYQLRVKRTIEGCNGVIDVKVVDSIQEEARYYFDMHSPSRMMKYEYWRKQWRFTSSIYQINSSAYVGWDKESLLEALKKSEDFKYLSQNMVKYSDPMKLLELYTKHPQIEKLEKVGLEMLISDKICGRKTYGAVNWRGKTVFKMTKLNRSELKFFIENTTKGCEELFVVQTLKRTSRALDEFDDAYALFRALNEQSMSLDELFSIDKPSRLHRYLLNQKKKNKDLYWGLNRVLGDFIDMLKDMKKLEMPINKRTIYPKELNKTHQDIAKMVKIEEDKEREERIIKRALELSKYETNTNGFVVIPAKSTQDFINESKALGHCVKNYVDSYANGKTNIFFMRKEEEIDKPLYTIEIGSHMRLIQCRGKGNYPIAQEEKDAKLALSVFLNKISKTKGADNEQIAN